MTLELYKVTVEFLAPSVKAEWEKRLSEHVRRSPSVPFSEPSPRPSHVEYHAAVRGDFGAVPLIEAGTLALLAVVGPRDCWERFQAMATAITYVGSVAIPEFEKQEEQPK